MLLEIKDIFDEGSYFLILLSISIILSCIFALVVKKQNKVWIIPLVKTLFLPGIIIHELSHYLTCKIFSVRISKVVFFSSETISGSVKPINLEEKSPLQLFYIVFSPTFIGIAIIFYLSPYISSLNVPVLPSLLLLYLLLSILITLHISFEDLQVFFLSFKSEKKMVSRDVTITLIACLVSAFMVHYIDTLFGLLFANIVLQYLSFLLYKNIRKIIPKQHRKTNFTFIIPEEQLNKFDSFHNRVSDLLDSNL